MATKCGVEDVETATEFFNDTGSVLYRHGDRDTNFVVLDPEWLTDVFASIASAKNVEGGIGSFISKGVLLHSHLDKIWLSEKYPSDVYPFLLSLLAKFELLYDISGPLLKILTNEESDLNGIIWYEANFSKYYSLFISC